MLVRGLILLLAVGAFIALPVFWSLTERAFLAHGWLGAVKPALGMAGAAVALWLLYRFDRSFVDKETPEEKWEESLSAESRRNWERVDQLQKQIEAAMPHPPSREEMERIGDDPQAIAEWQNRMTAQMEKQDRLIAQLKQAGEHFVKQADSPGARAMQFLRNDWQRRWRMPAVATGIIFAALALIAVVTRMLNAFG